MILTSDSSQVVDVFTVLPHDGSITGSRILSRDQLHIAETTSAESPKSTAAQPNMDQHPETTSQQEIYKSIRRTRQDPLSVRLDRDESEAAKAAMG